jgi:DNA gyrase/topoisomerase IV subunit A
MARPKKQLSLAPASDAAVVVDESLADFGIRNMTTYAIATNLNRSIPDVFDGCKPVHRRVLWATSQQERRYIKTARVVGDTLGRYHPHGDVSVSDAIETLINMPTPTVKGSGNWGSIVDDAAAMRYTEMKLSGYGLSFFHPDYINKEVTTFVPNYDDSDIEPAVLPARLPNVIINGTEVGIGVGITAVIPTFTPESVVEVLKRLLQGEKLEPLDYAKTLKYAHKYGGKIVKSQDNRKGWLQMFTQPQGRVQFESELEVDRDRKIIRISDWPPGMAGKTLLNFIGKVRAFAETARCHNVKGTETYQIECKPAYNYAQFDKFVEKVRAATRRRISFKLNVTQREVTVDDGIVKTETKILALAIPDLLKLWLRLRLQLEVRSLNYRVSRVEKAIAHSKLLIYACDHLESGVQALRSKDPKATLVKLMKITEDEAQTLLDLRFIQWSKLDQTKIKEKLREQQEELQRLKSALKAPRAAVLADLDDVLRTIEKDRQVEKKEETETLVLR